MTGSDNREAWRSAVGPGAEVLWEAFPEHAAPRLPRELEQKTATHWQVATAASLVACIVSLGIAFQATSRVDELTVRLALNELQSREPSEQLRAANVLLERSGRLSDSALATLNDVMGRVEDPNVQLAILEVLVDSGYVESEADLRLPPEVDPSRARFLRASFASLYAKDGHRAQL